MIQSMILANYKIKKLKTQSSASCFKKDIVELVRKFRDWTGQMLRMTHEEKKHFGHDTLKKKPTTIHHLFTHLFTSNMIVCIFLTENNNLF